MLLVCVHISRRGEMVSHAIVAKHSGMRSEATLLPCWSTGWWVHEKRGCCSSRVRKSWRLFQRLLCGWLGWYAVSSRGCTRAFCSRGQGSQPCACASSMPFPCGAQHMGKINNSSVPGRKVNVQEEPACRKKSAAIMRRLRVVLTKGFDKGSASCCQGDGWLLRVRKRVLALGKSRRDFVPSFPAVLILSHQSL